MTYVYKALPTGGFTAKPAESPVVRARLVSQGWTLEPPTYAPAPAAEPTVVADDITDAPAPKKRGRLRESVN